MSMETGNGAESAPQGEPEPAPEGSRVPLARSPERFLNRELSDLALIARVLEESCNDAHPLLERLRFLSISADLLDQFFTVRVSSLRRAIEEGDSRYQSGRPDGPGTIAARF